MIWRILLIVTAIILVSFFHFDILWNNKIFDFFYVNIIRWTWIISGACLGVWLEWNSKERNILSAMTTILGGIFFSPIALLMFIIFRIKKMIKQRKKYYGH